jgi:hypothetical protein
MQDKAGWSLLGAFHHIGIGNGMLPCRALGVPERFEDAQRIR